MTHPLPSGQPAFATLNHALAHWAATRPQALALAFIDGTERVELSYRELHERALRVAAHLSRITQPGDRVVLVFEQGADYLVAFLGCCYARVVAATGASPDEFRRLRRLVGVINDCGARVILSVGQTACKLAPVLAEVEAELTVVDVQALGDAPASLVPRSAQDGDLMFLQYTSGSTSSPKGVMLSHRAVSANLEVIKRLTRQHARSVHVSWLPLFHDMGLILMSLSALYGGCPLYLMAPAEFLRNPLRWLELISQVRGTVTAAPDFAYRLCMERSTAQTLAALDLSSLEILLNGSEPIRVDNVEAFHQVFGVTGLRRDAMVAGYGMAEVAVLATLGPILRRPSAFDARALEADGVARPCERHAPHARLVAACGPVDHGGYDVQIVAPQTGQALDGGRVGEVWLSGASVAEGYWDNPKATRAAFNARLADVDHAYLRTGDLGFVFEGSLYVCGRLKEMMIVRGRNVFPGDVCAVAEQVTDTMKGRRAAAFSVDGEDGEQIVIVCAARVNEHNYRAVAAQITGEVARLLGVTPSAILFVQNRALKRTTSGKVQHRAMRDEFLEGRLVADLSVLNHGAATFGPGCRGHRAAEDAPANTPATIAKVPGTAVRAVGDACAEVLGCGRLEAAANLFEHGLDSLRAVQLLDRLRSEFGAGQPLPISLADLVELQTPQAIASVLFATALSLGSEPNHELTEMTV